MIQIRFDDLAALGQRVGEEFSPYGEQLLITQEMIDRFADLTGDRQWIHVDVERARRESPFKTTIAHGFFILSLVPRLRVRSDLQLIGYGNVTNYGSDKLRFVSPVPAGSTVHARCRLVAAEAKPKGTLCTEEIEISVVGQPSPALSYLMLMLYQPGL
jgi:acyl dehydratase